MNLKNNKEATLIKKSLKRTQYINLNNIYRTTKDRRHLNTFYQSHSMNFVPAVLEADSSIVHIF